MYGLDKNNVLSLPNEFDGIELYVKHVHTHTYGREKKTGGSHTKEKKKTKKQIENETVRINASLALSKWAKRAEHLLLLSTLFFFVVR